MKLPLTGRCLCGSISYEILKPPVAAYVCHCADCQHGTGSAFSVAVLVPDQAFRSTGGEARSVFGGVTLSGRVKQRRVCPDCGTWIFGDPRPRGIRAGLTRAVRAGTLDDTSWVRPTHHFFTRNAQPWVVIPAGVEAFETQPDH
ncbi:aldehyde-activating protein [Dankookia rubra]|uniref:Aldehyde-activating protein n=1 Tax=Dankookia rubra TaxID=1442381 RepID=A0A4R5QC89_9PROT|nr:GFA family protein [Dankookia rubra]TDH60714.1 aldehyde-activating protein [Dankookia rubra]